MKAYCNWVNKQCTVEKYLLICQMVHAVGFSAGRRLLIGKYSQLCRASSRHHVHWCSPVKIDCRIPVLQDSFWKPAGRSCFPSPPVRQWSSGVCPKKKMVNQTAEESHNDCENGELALQFEELTIPLPWGNLAGKFKLTAHLIQ